MTGLVLTLSPNSWPPFYTLLDLDLETSAGEASVRIPCDVDNSYGWQL